MPTLYYCYDLTEEGRYCGSHRSNGSVRSAGSTHPEEKSCFLCAECLAEAEGQAQALEYERVLETLTQNDSHQEAFCWECGARLTDAESPHTAWYAKWLDGDLESQYEDAQNGGLDID